MSKRSRRELPAGKRTVSSLNEVAPPGQVFICVACCKRSRDRLGLQALDDGWAESCTSHAVLLDEVEAQRAHVDFYHRQPDARHLSVTP